jgi:hypothetical protein
MCQVSQAVHLLPLYHLVLHILLHSMLLILRQVLQLVLCKSQGVFQVYCLPPPALYHLQSTRLCLLAKPPAVPDQQAPHKLERQVPVHPAGTSQVLCPEEGLH